MDENHERRLRRRAVRLHGLGQSLRAIGRRLERSAQWVAKWVQRFTRRGPAGLRSRSRRPPSAATALPAWVRRQVLRLRRALERAPIGLIGAPAIQRAWRKERLPAPPPSVATIKRILQRSGRTRAAAAGPAAYFPAPQPTPSYPLQAMDWTERYLVGGVKVYAFHTLDLANRAAKQTISPNKASGTVRQHTLASWQTLGIPAFLQLDNDGVFNGGYKVKRVIGQFVRLCLYVGVELIFLPVAEPERNGLIESFNHLWSKAFYDRRRFRTLARVQASSGEFESWYMHDYSPPQLSGQTPAQAAVLTQPYRRLSAGERLAIPGVLPITAGRIHFIRPVRADGTIPILNESWPVGKRWAGQYVWATVSTDPHTLSIYHRRSAAKPVRLLRRYAYPLAERVVPVSPEFRSQRHRRQVSTML